MQIIFIRVHKLIVQSDLSVNLPWTLQPIVQLTYIYQEPYSPQYSSPTFTRNLAAPSTAHLHLPGTLQPPVQLTYIYQEPYSPPYSSPTFTRNLTTFSTTESGILVLSAPW